MKPHFITLKPGKHGFVHRTARQERDDRERASKRRIGALEELSLRTLETGDRVALEDLKSLQTSPRPTKRRRLRGPPAPAREVAPPEDFPERFSLHCTQRLVRGFLVPNTCVFWTGKSNRFNYKNRQNLSPARFAYEIYHQKILPRNVRIGSRCRMHKYGSHRRCGSTRTRTICVNPLHLYERPPPKPRTPRKKKGTHCIFVPAGHLCRCLRLCSHHMCRCQGSR